MSSDDHTNAPFRGGNTPQKAPQAHGSSGEPLKPGHLSHELTVNSPRRSALCLSRWHQASRDSERHKDGLDLIPHRNPPMTRRRRPEGKPDRSWTMTRTERTRPTSRGRVCSSSMMSGGTPRRRSGTHLSLASKQVQPPPDVWGSNVKQL